MNNDKSKNRSLSTSFAVGLLNSSARTGAMATRMITRNLAKSSGLDPEKQKLITSTVDSGTRGATDALKYATSIKAQDDARAAFEKSKAALANPQESLQIASQKATEIGNQAYATINNPANQEYVKKGFSNMFSSAKNLANKGYDFAKEQANKQTNQNPSVAPSSSGGKMYKYKHRKSKKRSMKKKKHIIKKDKRKSRRQRK
jgi:hypothetical protein